MRILLTNDDGIDAPGLEALHKAAVELGDPVVIAPVARLSGCSHRVTTDEPIRLKERGPGRFAIEGTPADCVRIGLHGVAPHVIVQQSLVIGGDRRRNALFKCVTLARHQVDPKSCSQSEEVAPRVAIAFGKLIDQLLYTGGGLGDDLLLFSLPQRHLCTERTFEQSLEVGCN